MSKQLPELQRQVKLDATVPQDYTQAYGALAAVPSVLGQFGANMAQQASNAFSAKMGYEAGKNPKGSLLPPITQSDAAYVKAYESSAQATLSVNGQEAMLKGQVMLAGKDKLSQGDIEAYHNNMRQTIDQQIALAPDSIKSSLKQSLDMSLASSTAKLNVKLLGQQHDERVDQAKQYTKSSTETIFEMAQNDPSAAQKLIDDANKIQDSYASQGLISKSTAQGNKEALQVSALAGKWIGMGRMAASSGIVDEHGNKMDEADFRSKVANINSVDGMSFVQVQQAKTMFMNQMVFEEKMRAKQQGEMYSQYALKVHLDTMTAIDWMSAQRDLSIPNFDNLIFKETNKANARTKETEKLTNAYNVYGKPEQIRLTSDLNHDMLTARINDEINNGKDAVEATIQVMNGSTMQDEILNKRLSNDLRGMDIERFKTAARIYDGINITNPKNVQLSREALNNLHLWKLEGMNSTDQNVQNEVFRKINEAQKRSPEDIKNDREYANDWIGSNYRGVTGKDDLFYDITGVKIKNIVGANQVRGRVIDDFLFNMAYQKNPEVAIAAAKEGFNRNYGPSYMDNSGMVVYAPIEKVTQIPSNRLGIVHADLADQFEMQVVENNNNPNSYARYKVTSRPDEQALLQARSKFLELEAEDKKLSRKGVFSQERKDTLGRAWMDYNNALKEYSQAQTTVVKIKDGKSKEYLLGIEANAPLSYNPSDPNVVGDYSIYMYDKDTGQKEPFTGTNGVGTTGPRYRPNIPVLQKKYIDLYSINQAEKTSNVQALMNAINAVNSNVRLDKVETDLLESYFGKAGSGSFSTAFATIRQLYGH